MKNAILEVIANTVETLDSYTTEELLDAMNVSTTNIEMQWIADVLERTFPFAVYEWWNKKGEATVDDLARYIDDFGLKERKADKKTEKKDKEQKAEPEKKAKPKAEKKAEPKKTEKKTEKKAKKKTAKKGEK